MRTWAIAMAMAVVINTMGFSQVASSRRVRSPNVRLQALIDDASSRSPTFAAIVRAIEATNGVVYVEDGRCEHGVSGCLVSVAGTREYRFLRIRVTANREERPLMATIAHELRHALEILGDPTITSTQGLIHFYLRNGSKRPGGSRETDAAIETGQAVSAELERYERAESRR